MAFERRVAADFLKDLMRAYPPSPVFREVDGQAFRHVSHRFYRRSVSDLEEVGFTWLGDIQKVLPPDRASPDPESFTRVMVDAGRTTVVGLVHTPVRWTRRMALIVARMPTRYIEFESCTRDWAYQITTNQPSGVMPLLPSSMRVDHAPRSWSLDELFHRHSENTTRLKGSLWSIHSVEDLLVRQAGQHDRIRAHLESIGWITPEYLRVRGVPSSRVETVLHEVRRLLTESSGREFG